MELTESTKAQLEELTEPEINELMSDLFGETGALDWCGDAVLVERVFQAAIEAKYSPWRKTVNDIDRSGSPATLAEVEMHVFLDTLHHERTICFQGDVKRPGPAICRTYLLSHFTQQAYQSIPK